MYAVLYLPSFRLQAVLRLKEGEACAGPMVLVDDREKRSPVLEMNAAARREGVSIGSPVPLALARCADLRIIPRVPSAERSAGDALLQTAFALSPEIEATASGICTVRLRLPPGKDAGEEGWRAIVLLEALGLKGLAGVAPNPDLALLAARRARPVLVVREPSDFLDALPVSVLRPPPFIVELLGDWGIHTLRQLRSLPRAELIDRLGPEAGRLWERASGQGSRPLHVVEPPREFVESFSFEHEVDTLEPLLFLLRRFLDHLSRRLRCMGRVAGSMLLTLPLERGEAYERFFSIPSPAADSEVLFRILFTHLESLRLEQRPVGITLRLEPVLPAGDQFQLFETALRDPNRLGETLARLSALVGVENTGICLRENTHLPDTWRLESPQFHKPVRAAPFPSLTGLPLRRHRPAPPAETGVLEGAPARVTSAVANGRIISALGPYRLSGRWWEPSAWAQEEWDVELENGSLLRLARLSSGWVVEGYYELSASPAPVS